MKGVSDYLLTLIENWRIKQDKMKALNVSCVNRVMDKIEASYKKFKKFYFRMNVFKLEAVEFNLMFLDVID